MFDVGVIVFSIYIYILLTVVHTRANVVVVVVVLAAFYCCCWHRRLAYRRA